MVGFNINFKNIIKNIKTILLGVFLSVGDVEDIWTDIQAKRGYECRANPSIRWDCFVFA